MTKSANDVAVVVAENLGGSVEGFAEEMTRKARALGMSRTVYRNPSGLPDPEQVTTARDLTILARAIQDRFPNYYRYFQTRSFRYAGRSHGNHNKLLGRVEGVDGIKTASPAASGFNLMTNARTDDRHIVAVVLGGRSGGHRDGIVTALAARICPAPSPGPATPIVAEASGGAATLVAEAAAGARPRRPTIRRAWTRRPPGGPPAARPPALRPVVASAAGGSATTPTSRRCAGDRGAGPAAAQRATPAPRRPRPARHTLASRPRRRPRAKIEARLPHQRGRRVERGRGTRRREPKRGRAARRPARPGG